MKLARLVPVAAVSLVVLISVMLLNFGIAQWRIYQAARARPEAIRLIHEAMSVVEKISFERGPANGVLGDDEPADAAKRERLRQARSASDAAIATLRASLTRDVALRNDDVEQTLYKTRVLLAQARRKVDKVAALPRRERTQARIMDDAVHPMFDVVPVAMETVTLLIHRVNTVCGRLPDAVATAQLANMMREYAGRLGSQFTAALTEQKPVARSENEAIRLLRGRVEQLRMLVELPLQPRSADRRIVAAVEQMERRYFGASLDAAARVERMSDERRLPYQLDTAQFAALYVPGLDSIVHLRDVLMSIAMEEAEKDVLDARRHLIRMGLVGCVITSIVILIFAIIHRRVVHPLFAIKQSLVSLADGNLNTRIPVPIRNDEIRDILDAVRVLQNNSIERERLEVERQRLIDELEASEMHQITLNTELEQRVRQQTALLERSHHELENILYSVANDFHAQLHVFGPLVEALTRHAGKEPAGELDDLLAVLRTCVQKLGSCLAMLHELRWLRQLDIDTSDVDMTVVVAQVVDELSKRYPGTTVEIDALPPLLSDRIMVHKIIANLLDNALKYSSKSDSPRVEIGGRVLQDSKTYWIRDNGTGFDPQAARCVFEPFKRLHSDSDYEGKGIGLTIAQRLVERLGGRIWAESRPGQGATFFFTLCEPATQERASRSPAADFDTRSGAPVTG